MYHREDHVKDEHDLSFGNGVGRRELMKIGAGAVMTTLGASGLLAQSPEEAVAKKIETGAGATADVVETGAGYSNDANRASGNGPMDETTKKLVDYIRDFNESHLNDSVTDAVGKVMVDSIA